ncbi:MAG: transporter substrate-binding domain-containing protein [Phyllobacteriaceae bacterium]|nr:transporter substrate-binding domain-containing protein [Phyllobacteriaceae bacterium]
MEHPPRALRPNAAARRRLAATAGLLLALTSGGAEARPLDKVKESGVLVVSVYRDFAPWAFVENGEPKGIDVDLGKLLAEAVGVRAEFMIRPADEDVDGDLRANVWRGDVVEHKRADVMMHVPVDHDLAMRNDMAVICCGYGQERMGIAYDPEAVPVKSFAAFRSRRVAVEGDTTADIWLSAAFNGILGPNIDRGRTFAVAMENYHSGRDTALVAPRAQLEWAAKAGGRRTVVEEWPMPGIVKSSWPICIAVRFDSRDLGHALDGALEEARADGRVAAIHAAYGVTWLPPQD